MLYWLVEFSDKLSVLNVFRYITFRTGGAVITGLVFVFLFGQFFIDRLRLLQGKGQPIRSDGPQSHIIKKAGTPTMGGLMILSGMLLSTLLWANPANPYVWVVLWVTIGFGFVGFYDDYLKVKQQTHMGFAGRTRLAIETLIAGTACVMLVQLGHTPFSTSLVFPFFKELVVNLGWFYVLFAAFIIVGAGNAVNLTDGLDGLAIVPVMIAAASFGMIAYLSGNAVFADYLQIHYVAGTGELAVLCGAVLGAGLGFLWFNAPPASIFHGRYRLSGAGWHDRRHCGRDQTRDRARRHRRLVRARSGFGDRASGVVQTDRQTRVQDGAHPPSFRAVGLDRAADRYPLLDCLGCACARRPVDPETAMIPIVRRPRILLS